MQEANDQQCFETKEQGKLKKMLKNGKKPIAACLLAGCMAMAGIGAYFTGTDTVENKFTVSGDLQDKITVVEKEWSELPDEDGDGIPDAAENMVPLQTVVKDPTVQNDSEVETWLFAQVKVPVANVAVVGEDGAPEEAASHELFTYTVNAGWTEQGEAVVADGYATHTYLYNAKVAAKGATAKVFDSVTLINLAEAQGTSGEQTVTVTGMGIQAEGLDTAAAAYAAYTAQNA